MQAKDLDEAPLLALLASRPGVWHHHFRTRPEGAEKRATGAWPGLSDNDRSIRTAWPDGDVIPEKVILAKVQKLIRRGKIQGCWCGCRGDFYIG